MTYRCQQSVSQCQWHMMVICVLDTGAHPEMTLPRGAWVWLNRFRTGAGRFRFCLYKWGMVFSAACGCDAEQTDDHVVLQCPIHRPPHGLHGLTVLDDTIEWLLNICPVIVRPSRPSNNWLKRNAFGVRCLWRHNLASYSKLSCSCPQIYRKNKTSDRITGKRKPLTAGKIHFPLQSDAVAAFESLREELLARAWNVLMKTNRSILNPMPRTLQSPPSSVKAIDLLLSCHAPCRNVNVTSPVGKEAASINYRSCAEVGSLFIVARSH